jgi:hypothetical protein
MERLIQQMDEILADRLGMAYAPRRWSKSAVTRAAIVTSVVLLALVAAWWFWLGREAGTGQQSGLWHPPPNRAYWDVDDSIVYLEATGTKRQLYYVEPSRDMLARGVVPGALLFEGVIQQNGGTSDGKTGQTYAGTVFAYFGKCAPRRYEAEGPVLPGPRIQLVGMAPRIDTATCKQIDEEERTLVLDFKEKK